MLERAAIAIDPDIQGGVPRFAGTRVPVQSLFDAMMRGRSIDYFLEEFPAVSRGQVDRVLNEARRDFKPLPTEPGSPPKQSRED